MKLSKRNSEKETVLSDKAARWVANGILKTQNKFADALGKFSSTWKSKQQWIFLSVVCLVFGGLSFVAIVQSFNKKHQNVLRKSTRIKIPQKLPEERMSVALITDHEIKQVHLFKHTMDSLSKTSTGKMTLNKLLNSRPGLMDSLEMVEQLYYSQKK